MLDEVYQKLGQIEMDDMAAGVRALWMRPYFDKTRVGIYGSSYGGYSSALSILKHPDVWAAASASSAANGGLRFGAVSLSPTSASFSRAASASRWRFHMLA